jgi:hypothetical protein
MAMYAQTTGKHSTNAGSLVSIPGLSVTVPAGVDTLVTVILNLPLPYAEGNNFPGLNVGVAVDKVISPVVGGFTYSEQVPQSAGRVPTTLVLAIPLAPKPQVIEGLWSGVRGSTVIIDTPATLTALF